MSSAHSCTGRLNNPDLLRRVNALRSSDNVSNWYYLCREYLFLALVIGLAVTCYRWRAAAGLHWAWDILVSVPAIVLIGAGQHRLITLGHEASHYMLFRNRWLNELASDCLCMFPLFSVTHNYRLQHLAHHQYVNDPERDPDLAFMRESGHEHHFPMPRLRFWWKCVVRPFFWVPGLVRYLGVRARHTAMGGGAGPYRRQLAPSRLLVRVGVIYLAALVGALWAIVRWGDARLVLLVPAGMLAAVLSFYVVVPDRFYPRTIVRPVISPRAWTALRLTYATILFTVLAWLTLRTGRLWALDYGLLWVLPLTSTFAYFMVLREAVQHGGAGREPFRHTRIFEGNPLVRWAVFPLGMDYHLPHHCFPMVPHYRLGELHRLLLEAEAYAQDVPVVAGYLFPNAAQSGRGRSILIATDAKPRPVDCRTVCE
jgi:fatty acid desaturase